MKTMNRNIITLALGMTAASLAAGDAAAYSEKVQNFCKSDYLAYCLAHPVGSTGMRRCMEANGRSLSKQCVNALVDSGEIPRKYRR